MVSYCMRLFLIFLMPNVPIYLFLFFSHVNIILLFFMYMYWLLSIKVRLYANTCAHIYVWFCCWCLLLHGRCQICPKQLVVWMYLFWSFEKQRSFQLKACMKAFNLWHTVIWLCISKWEARWPNGAGLCIESSRSKKWFWIIMLWSLAKRFTFTLLFTLD